jgi:hypothetical protein
MGNTRHAPLPARRLSALTAAGREATAEAQRQWRAKRPEKAKIKDDLAKMKAAE